MIRKVKSGEDEIAQCDIDPVVAGRILESIVNQNAAIVALLGMAVATNAASGNRNRETTIKLKTLTSGFRLTALLF